MARHAYRSPYPPGDRIPSGRDPRGVARRMAGQETARASATTEGQRPATRRPAVARRSTKHLRHRAGDARDVLRPEVVHGHAIDVPERRRGDPRADVYPG